ncbi:hypothetical protein [Anianabacter salinae]|uniref:hypothetical protein n=1 Tax=Anianabacter salinae TaxID=2851023 RepID=UPI00225DEBF6|nr:hypothetical protein [Anianabacter salinae]MBV0912910.1 hypothetical protein [Anianabacter salinae]
MFRIATIALILSAASVTTVAASECPYREPAMGAQTCPANSHYDTSYKRCIVG